MVEVLRDPPMLFADWISIPTSYLVIKDPVTGFYYVKNGRTASIEKVVGDPEHGEVAIQAAIDAIGERGGRIALSSGLFRISGPVDLNKGYVELCGEGWSWGGHGSALEAAADIEAILKITASYVYVHDLNVLGGYAHGWTNDGVRIGGQEIILQRLNVRAPGRYGISKPVTFPYNYHLYIRDCRIDLHELPLDTGAGIYLQGVEGCEISGCHFYRGRYAIYTHEGSSFWRVLGNLFEGQPQIGICFLNALRGVFTNNCFSNIRREAMSFDGKNMVVIGNFIEQPAQELDNTYSGIYLRSDYSICAGNIIDGDFDTSPNRMKYGIYLKYRETIKTNLISGNTIRRFRTAGLYEELGAASESGYIIERNIGYITENSGLATFSGDGTTKTFSFAHGLSAIPNHVSIEAKSLDACGDKYWSADATNIVISFATAPPAGTDNINLSWDAKV